MNLEEIKALKDHAANGGFTSPHKVSALIAKVERLNARLADIKAAAAPIVEKAVKLSGIPPKAAGKITEMDIPTDLKLIRALAAALEGE